MKIICISGKAGHGKDYTANLLKKELEEKNKTVMIVHNADLLKYICKSFFNWDGEKDEEGRQLLQYIGTEIFREYDQDFWVSFIHKVLECSPVSWDYVLIPDCRFANEIDYYRNNSNKPVVHIRVVRKNYKSTLTESQQHHSSELMLDDVKPDILMINNGTNEYIKAVKQLAKTLIEDVIVFGV